jgi:NADH-quinone oxidoreductase subunit J
MFLFVIMLLGVDRAESLRVESLKGQRPLAAVAGVGALGMLLIAVFVAGRHQTAPAADSAVGGEGNINALARSLFGTHVFAFEVTSVLLVIAVAGTVLLAKRPPRSLEKIKQLEELTK